MRLLLAVLLVSLTLSSAFGQNYTISTFAGGGLPVNIPGTSAGLGNVGGVAVDSAGNVFITASDYDVVLRLDAKTGVLSLVAGTGTAGFGGDNGPATGAQLNGPEGIAVDSAGNLYFADTYNNRIRKVSNGVITTVAGGGSSLGDNGPATSAYLGNPNGVAVDSAGNLYIADSTSSRIRKVSNGVITTVAGNGTAGFSGDNGPATSAQLDLPEGVAVDSSGNLYIADSINNRVRKVSNGVITTVTGNGTFGLSGDNGPATSAQLDDPYGVAVDAAGNLYITDNGIRKVSNGVITTVAGNGACGFSGDNGPATSAQLCEVHGVALDSAGNLYIADTFNDRVRKVSNGVITTIAGNGSSLGDNGPATSAELDSPEGVAADSAGNLYIADFFHSRIRKVSNGTMITVAGNGTYGFSGDNGPATSAEISYPSGVAVDPAGNLYLADGGNNRIRKVSNGVITTVAGSGAPGFSGDNGPATSAQLISPYGVAVDSAGNLYISDSGNNRVRKVSNGAITTVAGNGTAGFSGDNGPATSAELYFPEGVAVDSAGDLYIADSNNNRVRKVSNGVITTVAGNGPSGFSGDNGPAASAELNFPHGVAVDSAGSLYIADYFNNRIRKVSNGVITTVAGNATVGFSGDNGPATSAGLYLPEGVAVDSAGNVYIADTDNNRIRLLFPASSTAAPAISQSGGVVNGASFQAEIAPNSWMTIFGTNLSAVTDTWTNAVVNGTLPTALDGVEVSVGGQPAYISSISPTQINALAPNVSPGTVLVTVTNSNGTSSAIAVTVQAVQPAFFQWPGNYAVATRQDYSLAVKNGTFAGTTTTPAKPGDVIILWGSGFGPTSPAAPVGVVTPSLTSYNTANTVTVTVGGVPATVIGAALAADYAGLYQVAIQIPTSLANGDYPVVASVSGAQSSSMTLITVQN